MKITLTALSTKNLATLAQRIINSSQSGNYTIIEGHPLLMALVTSYSTYDAVYTKLTYSGKGKEVAAADKERDAAFSSIKAFLNGYRNLPFAANHTDAEALYTIFKQFGLNLDTLSYSAQTAQLKKLIEELEKPENTQRIENLTITTAFNDLKTKHQAFETVFAEHSKIKTSNQSINFTKGSFLFATANIRNTILFATAFKAVSLCFPFSSFCS